LERATLAFGYGLSVTPLQLAGAFSVLASDGFARAPSFLALDEAPLAQPVLDPQAARAVRGMLEGVVEPGGTGTRAAVPGYRIAGKTGTVRKSTAQGYSEERYVAVFAGMAPASAPRLVAVVVIDEPAAGAYYGGQVAAPVFGRVMSGALRLLDIAPDASGDDAPALQAEGPDAEAPA
jgi:cell division protein FtsI (penicillin-binding protein 3)